MPQLEQVALLTLLILGGLAGASLFPTMTAFAMRVLFRQSPALREAFIGRGRWIAISRRFGLPYVIGALVAPFVWVLAAHRLIADTELGAWLLFGPALLSIVVGVCLGALLIARWTVSDPEA